MVRTDNTLKAIESYNILAGLISWLPTRRMRELKGSAGALLPNTEGRLVDEEGNDAPEGVPGELWLRGPSVMK